MNPDFLKHTGKHFFFFPEIFLSIPLFHDETILESLLQIFNMLYLKSGFCSPAGTSHLNLMTLLLFLGWRDRRMQESSEFVTRAGNHWSVSGISKLVHFCSAEQCSVAWAHQPSSRTSC